MKKFDENFVAMATHKCPICGKDHQHNTEILMHKQGRAIPKDLPASDWSLCKKDELLFKSNYIALIETENNPEDESQRLQMEDAIRTGRLAHLKRHAFEQVFNTEIGPDCSFVFIDAEAMDKLIAMGPKDEPCEQP
jgi:hypothetical protein